MALFGSKKKTEEKKTDAQPEVKPAPKIRSKAKAPARAKASSSAPIKSHVLIRPRITEKAATLTAANVYTFDIAKTATKREVAAAVQALYKVTPVKVHVVNVRGKRVKMRRKRGFGTTAGSRKAYVYLKKGEEIQFA
jgi:large subunit ribosomal protein L23